MDAATIEEANRLRVAMGMKPLPVPGAKPREAAPESLEDRRATYEGRQALAADNYKQALQAEDAKKKRDEKAAAIKRAREKAQRFTLLSGTGLGDAEEEGDADAKMWLKGRKKRQQKIKTGTISHDREATAAEYSSKDLAGIKVVHEMSTFLDGDEQILTLKDTTVLDSDGEGDALENLDMRENEKLRERLDLKKRRPAYDPNDIDENGERSILAQYDDEIHGKKRKAVTLDGEGSIAELPNLVDGTKEKKSLQALSLDILPEAPASDYLDISEVKIKKPKKSKKGKSTRVRSKDDDDALFQGNDIVADHPVDTLPNVPLIGKKRVADATFADDDDLQATLARQRVSVLKKRKKTGPEALAKLLKVEGHEMEPDHQTGGLILDEISAFVDGMQKGAGDPQSKPRRKQAEENVATAMEDSDNDIPMTDIAARDEEAPPEAPIEEEQRVDQGMGAAISILRQRGLIEDGHGADASLGRKHAEFINERRRRLQNIEEEAKKQREHDRPMLERLSAKDQQEYARKQNANREYQTSKVLQDMYNQGYQPDVNITYTDEHGRSLDRKEAWKHLSHQFHGKSSGNAKTSKLLKKIEQEKKDASRSLFDSSKNAGTAATAHQLKKRKEAGVRLG